MAMMIHDLLKKDRTHCDVRIIGTDINAESIENAVRGEYPEQEFSEVKKKYIDAYFTKISVQYHEPVYRISNDIKSMVRFSAEDMISRLNSKTARSDHFNLVLCRNVLIYMNRKLQDDIFPRLTEMIYEGGYLVLGETETLPGCIRESFVQTFPGIKIFRKGRTRCA